MEKGSITFYYKIVKRIPFEMDRFDITRVPVKNYLATRNYLATLKRHIFIK